MNKGVLIRKENYKINYLTAGILFLLSSLTYFGYAVYDIINNLTSSFTFNEFLDVFTPKLPEIIFFLFLILLSFFLFIGKNSLFLTVGFFLSTIMSGIVTIISSILIINSGFVIISDISFSGDELLHTFLLISILIYSVITLLAHLGHFIMMFFSSISILFTYLKKFNKFIFLITRICGIIFLIFSTIMLISLNIMFAMEIWYAFADTISTFEIFTEYFLENFGNTIASQVYLITYIILSLGFIVLSGGLKKNELIPVVTVGIKDMED